MSDVKRLGDLSVTLLSEDILVDYTIRTIKVTNVISIILDPKTKTFILKNIQLVHRPRRKGSNSSSSSSLARGSERLVTQLVFGRWPEVGMPNGHDLLAFVKTAFSCKGHSPAAKTLIQSRWEIKTEI